MRILHVVKTSSGAGWAAEQVARLVEKGADVHVALPDLLGSEASRWARSGATVHEISLDLPIRQPWKIRDLFAATRRLVDRVNPDLIHSHFVGTTLTLRLALGAHHPIKRCFQVAGPLHLEHKLYRELELRTAGEADYWIPSSDCVQKLLINAGIAASRIHLSYHGTPFKKFATERSGELRRSLGISDETVVVGNVSWFYSPKHYLGQMVGLKGHETLIDALGIVTKQRSNVLGLLIGSGFNGAVDYENKLRLRAARQGGNAIVMPGKLEPVLVQQGLPDLDCVVHVPLSENCGGVVEPLWAGVPTIASNVGGLPEVVFDRITGRILATRDPGHLAEIILQVLDDLPAHRAFAEAGRQLVGEMFDIERTSEEILNIYRFVLNESGRLPQSFDSSRKLAHLSTFRESNKELACASSLNI